MGGQSRRMGRDKADIFWQGERLWQRQYRLLSTVSDPVWRSVRHGVQPQPGLVVDASPFPGPVPSLIQALRTMPGTWLLVVAVDLPRIDQTLLTALVAARSHHGVTITMSAGDAQPLLSIWHRTIAAALPSSEHLVGMSMHSLLTRVPTSYYHLPPDRAHLLVNVNTPEELEAARR